VFQTKTTALTLVREDSPVGVRPEA